LFTQKLRKSKTPAAAIPSAGVSGFELWVCASYKSLFPEDRTPLADGVQQHIRRSLLLLTEWRLVVIFPESTAYHGD
jgi:hypothetical protein